MKKLIVANWKMNPDSPGRAVRLAREIQKNARRAKNVEVVVAPPFIFLSDVGSQLSNVRLGAQDAFFEAKGAYTGEVSGHQLKHLRVEYVIIGHSERRALGETDDMVNKKVKAALREGLKVILCVGEPWGVRRQGIHSAKSFVRRQLQKDLQGLSNVRGQMSNVIVAYEPVWAIGTGKSDKPEDTLKMVRFIKEFLSSHFKFGDARVLYGGSVNSRNAQSFLEHPEISGALVGGASLQAGEFKKIIKIASVF